MILPGLASVTFRQLSAEVVIGLAAKAGLAGIEWGGDIHVPPGDLERAQTIGRMTSDAGLSVIAYGSYYTVAKSKNEGLTFDQVIKTAKALDTKIIRIWAGWKSSREATGDYHHEILEELRAIGDEAGRNGISLALEFHDNTLNDSYEACVRLFTELDHPSVKTYWQPMHGAGPDINGPGIHMILPWIAGFHVFHWWPQAEVRLPLQYGLVDWQAYIKQLSRLNQKIYGCLEFVKDDSTQQFLKDAVTLIELIRKNAPSTLIDPP